ncbi:MAG: ribosome silencing factor [Betaproteobacteria bacterium]|nr:ribosome silencing factor [Betaproteobacteria bacterium]
MDIRKKQRAVVEALEDIKGRDIVVFNTERLSAYFERVVLATGDSTRQVKALADNVQEKLKSLGARIHGMEGDGSEWVLVDLGDIVVHVMHPSARLTYNLEALWGGKDVKIKREPEPPARVAPKAKAKVKAKTKVTVKVKAKTKAKTTAKTTPKTKTKTKAKTKTAPKGKVKAKAKTPAKTKVAAKARKAPAKKKKAAKRRA